MSTPIFIAKGHGYESGSQGRCELFDGFTMLAEPLGDWSDADRARRVFGNVTYGSHIFKLAVRTEEAAKRSRSLYLLVHHGGGREVLRIVQYSGALVDVMLAAWLAMPEAALYATLHTLYRTAYEARDVAKESEGSRWRQAAVEKRIRQRSYPKRGIAKVWIEPKREDGESDQNFELRKMLAAPSKA
jgi:hypothetical protein